MLEVILNNFDLVVGIVLFVIGYFAGRYNERRHYASIRRREQELGDVLLFATRFPPTGIGRVTTQLVSGSVVISEDYFKAIVAGLYQLIGGRVRSYESLLDRARREAILRMKTEARKLGAAMIINIKFQTFAIGGRGGRSVKGVEMLAYGTALAAAAAPRG